MTEIERKALELVNELHPAAQWKKLSDIGRGELLKALCCAIEEYEEFRQEVSDAVESVINSTYITTPSRHKLERFIISKTDPLVEAVNEANGEGAEMVSQWVADLRAALAKRGLEIREKGE